MSFAFARKTVAGWWVLAAASTTVALAQTNFPPLHGESLIAGALPGDQVHPALSVSTNGGYIVWQDNATDPGGLGISARPLDSNLSPVGSEFRVNGQSAGDQEHPRVALLDNGGAVFVWQGGPEGFQHIYARFLSPSNTWASGDVMVNASTNYYQVDPAVGVLTNGNVVVVWSSFNQQGAGSMQDVFGQLFTPGGEKIGDEFPVNQFTPYNQRTPAVAALDNGGFAVAWVSEGERQLAPATNVFDYNTGQPVSQPGVDIYARIYDATGAPTVNEFLVNANPTVCANPVIASAADGSFMVAWGEMDMQVPKNGWDVFARPFTLSGGVPVSGTATEQYVNTQLFGNQVGPQIGASGTNYLIAWTTPGQGIFGQMLNSDGSHNGGEFQVNTTRIRFRYPNFPVAAAGADGSGRFVVAWPNPDFARGTLDLDLFGQLYAETTYVAPAYAANYGSPAFVASGSTGTGNGTGAGGATNSTGEPVQLSPPIYATSGTVVPTNYTSMAGSYSGLFYDTNGVAASSSGYFTARVTAPRSGKFCAYSARIVLGGRAYGLSGRFDLTTGQTTNSNPRTGLTVVLQLDAGNGGQISGEISGAGWSAQLLAQRSASTTPLAGRYTMVIPGTGDAAQEDLPAGSGFGLVTVGARGLVTWHGTLADGTPVSQSSTVSGQGAWPLFVPLYRGGGELLGWMQFTNGDLSGSVVWIRPGGMRTPYYPAGFTNEVQAAGSSYAPVNLRQSSMTSTLTLSGGGLGTNLTYSIQFGPRNKTTVLSGGKLGMSLAPPTGLFSGRAINPDTRRPFLFRGILMGNSGAGFFLGSNKSGTVDLNPAP